MRAAKRARTTRRAREREAKRARERDEKARAELSRRRLRGSLLDTRQGPSLGEADRVRFEAAGAQLTDAEANAGHWLRGMLMLAVPMAAEELKRLPWAEVERIGRACGEFVACRGDTILYRSKGTAEAFAVLARGLAVLSFARGGVTFMGAHFHDRHPDWLERAAG